MGLRNTPMPKTKKQEVGKLGEDIACKYLKKHEHEIIERNFWKKFGEIDIVAKKEGILHFVEVKSVSRDLDISSVVSCGTSNRSGLGGGRYFGRGNNDEYRPEDNLHAHKLKRLGRAIEAYLSERKISHETDWQIDAITVLVDQKKRIGRVEMLENIVL